MRLVAGYFPRDDAPVWVEQWLERREYVQLRVSDQPGAACVCSILWGDLLTLNVDARHLHVYICGGQENQSANSLPQRDGGGEPSVQYELQLGKRLFYHFLPPPPPHFSLFFFIFSYAEKGRSRLAQEDGQRQM